MIDPVAAAKLWLVIRPVRRIRQARANRRATRLSREIGQPVIPDYISLEESDVLAKLRTSTKAGAAGILTYAALQIIQGMFPELALDVPIGQLLGFPGLALPSIEGLVTAAVAFIAARLSLTPPVPGIL